MRIQLLDSRYPWLSRHGGFAELPGALRLNGCEAAVTAPREGRFARIAGNLYSTWRRYPPRDQAAAASECEFLLRMRWNQNAGHILFLENHLQFLGPPRNGQTWIGTIHIPRKCWTSAALDRLRRFPAITVLCDYMADQFSDIFDATQVAVLPYGVDASFFRPPVVGGNSSPQTLIYVGAWLRNTAMLARVVVQIRRRFPGAFFEFVVPLHARNDLALSAFVNYPSIRWHNGLSDEELRTLYQRASAMILPMDDSGANTAVVEALACGLPIVTTDVGGIRSYGGGTVFPIVANNDDSGFVNLVGTYLTDQPFRSSVSQASRRFAETKLHWPVAAREYIGAYRSLGCL
jgi:glycosyltransferase involved in cell wall biosynthesis